MDDRILLGELQALVDNIPAFADFKAASVVEQRWVAKAHALLSRYDKLAAISFQLESGSLTVGVLRQESVTRLVSMLQAAIADLELRIPKHTGEVYGPGAVYDFYRALKEIIESAQNSIFLIDPYLDEEVFHTYMTNLHQKVDVRILLMQYAAKVKMAIHKFATQNRIQIEVRKSALIHDRVLFIDGTSCWVLGQSINNAAKKKPTYIAPLSTDAAGLKLKYYNEIWSKGELVYNKTT